MKLLKILKFITTHPINHNQKLQSVVRFLKWQIGSRLVSGSVVFDWINNSKFIVRPGETGLTGNIYTGLHEFEDMAYILHVLQPEDLFVDIGANVGAYSILACAVAEAKGIAFEPIPSTYTRLVENIRLNNLEKAVECINEGIGSKNEELRFTSEKDTTNYALVEGETCSSSISVNVSTLDRKLMNYKPAVVKIDVEGFELPVLKGAKSTLANEHLNSVIIELNGSGSRYGYDENEILKIMCDYGFKTYSYDPFERSLKVLKGKNKHSGNTLFIRNEHNATQKLLNAKKYKVYGVEI